MPPVRVPFWGVASFWLVWIAGAAEGIPLTNALPVEGVHVRLTQPLGFHYHPGAAVVIEGTVRATGKGFKGGITVQEGPATGPRYEARLAFDGYAPTVFRLPVRLPAGAAALTLQVWEEQVGTAQTRARFTCVLNSHFFPVQAHERVVLQLGEDVGKGRPAGWHVSKVSPEHMPEFVWMYENVDLVHLGSPLLERLTPAASAALRAWVLGGGRLLTASTDQGTKAAVIQAGLTPLPSGISTVEADSSWWKLHAGLAAQDLERDQRGSLVFVRYRLGFGAGILFLQSGAQSDALKLWDKAVKDETLVLDRPQRTDERIWSNPFGYCASGAIASARRHGTLKWAVLGAGVLLLALLYASFEKTRYMAAGLGLGVVGLLAALLVNWFPVPAGVVTRLEVREVAGDARAVMHTAWASVHGVEDLASVRIHGPTNGTLLQLYYEPRELAESAVNMHAEAAWHIGFRSDDPQPAPVFRARRLEAQTAADRAATGPWLSSAAWSACVAQARGLRKLGGVRIEAEEIRILQEPSDPTSAYSELRFRGAQASVDALWPGLPESELQAYGNALQGVLDRVVKNAGPTWVLFGVADPEADPATPLLTVEGVRCEEGPRFQIWVVAPTL